MKYRSTRGSGRAAASKEAILRGIAEDGGLFVPERIPYVEMPLSDMTGLTYSELALYIMKMYLTDFTESELKDCIDKAYGGSKFGHEGIVPVNRQGDIFFLELYHGPTLAFKDIALSILPHLLMASIKELEGEKQAVILTATSGDTGVSALEGFDGIDGVRTIVFYPVNGVSDIQRRQMVTHAGKNSFVAGLEGNFDDAQGGVKSIFNDDEYRRLLADNGYILSSANSINIGRLIPQIVYYFQGYLSMMRDGHIKPGEQVNIAVPTGNFGNILAAYYAKQMGLPVRKLICASNENAVLCEYLRTGVYNRYRVFKTTCSPSMDILVSSNLERLNYYLSGENPLLISELMRKLSCFGRYEITREMRCGLDDFYGGYASDEETIESIGRVYAEAGYVMDTHTAVAYSVYKRYQSDSGDRSRTMIAATASPFKFAGSVCSGIGTGKGSCDEFELVEALAKKTGLKIPATIEALKYREAVHRTICSKENMKQEISRFLKV